LKAVSWVVITPVAIGTNDKASLKLGKSVALRATIKFQVVIFIVCTLIAIIYKSFDPDRLKEFFSLNTKLRLV
jgi:hypothetical protein